MASRYGPLLINGALPMARSGSLLVGILAALMISPNIPALETYWGGDVKLVQDYNSNIFLAARDSIPGPVAAWGQGADGRLDFSASDLHFNTNFNAQFFNRWYVDNDSLNYFNQLFGWRNEYLTERSVFTLDTQYNRVNSLTTFADLLSSSGFAFSRIPRSDIIVAPSWTYMLAEKTQMRIGYEFRQSTYDKQKDPSQNLYPNTVSNTAFLNLSYQMFERLKVTGEGSYNDYDLTSFETFQSDTLLVPGIIITPSVTRAIRTAMFMGGVSYNATDTINLSLGVGGQYNETVSPVFRELLLPGGVPPALSRTVPASRSSTLAPIYNVVASKRFEKSKVTIDVSRSIYPNIIGQLISFDRYNISGEHNFSPEMSVIVGGYYSGQTYPTTQQQASYTTEWFAAYSTLKWQWAERWWMNASYEYRTIRYGNGGATADSHGVLLNISYAFDKQEL